MTGAQDTTPATEQWRLVDEGWGRRAVDFATLCEPTNCREYVAMHRHLGLSTGDRLLDMACGSGLALELAGLLGASCAGIDASPRLLAVAQDRNPHGDLRVGDMNDLPWEDGSFDVVTSFRGIWGTTPGAALEAYRVLAPGGRLGITVWGHIKASPGAWAFTPFTLASEGKIQNQAAMVALGRPGAGEQLLAEAGFTEIERLEVPFVFEFADPEGYARALASTGPAFEAIEAVGESAFFQAAIELSREKVRQGLPLRAPVALVGYLATKPARRRVGGKSADSEAAPTTVGYLRAAQHTEDVGRIFEADMKGLGYVMNASRLWSHLPAALNTFGDLMGVLTQASGLTLGQRSVLVTTTAATLGDSYCSMAWGKKLADATTPGVAAALIGGDSGGLDDTGQALASWARLVVKEPNGITADDVQSLREAGFTEEQIFAITAFVAFRLAFSTVNDALGAVPDDELQASLPEPLRSAVNFGRVAPRRHDEQISGKHLDDKTARS
ncbi:MAG TPA: methyltransferase domain-containing protein [Acidimicrobiales bacterium]|nr:methyltransferase domain-containing protein [Acidimicrobiales bacterium]